MKQEWKDPRIDVQKFIPNEYVAMQCLYFKTPNILVRLFKSLTDARADDTGNDWQGDKMGFQDDCFDFLTHSNGEDEPQGFDTLPDGAPHGWYSSTNVASELSSVLEVHQSSKGQLSDLTPYGVENGPLYGYDSPNVMNGAYPGDMVPVIYFWGNYTKIDSTNYTNYGSGPNGS